MGRSTEQELTLSDTRKYRKFTAQQKTEIVLASLRGPKTLAELCREHEIADSLLRKWREQFLAAGAERLQGKAERTEADELRRQIAGLERALGRKTMEVEVAGELLRGWEGDSASPGPASSSRRAAPRPWSPGSRGSVVRRSTVGPSGHRGVSGVRWIASIGSCWRSRALTRPTGPGWSPRSPAEGSAGRST